MIIADSADKFAEGILDLLTEADQTRKLGVQGRKLVRDHYAWQKIIKDFTPHLKRLVSEEAQSE